VNTILNISAYLFVPIENPQALRTQLRESALALGLKGTVLLAHEGINLFLAGTPTHMHTWLSQLRADLRFAKLEVKESWSEQQPFKRLVTKVKNEIIRMNHPAINPLAGRAPFVRASTLKRWLDQGHDDTGRPVVMLDTRNAFEVSYGSFKGAIDWKINKFSEFPAALREHQHELQGKTVVSFCTGGIRCEKAALYMREQGLEDVLQLEGGILKYFEEIGQSHYQGDCFVFDERGAVNSQLAPSTVDKPQGMRR
jgi:UPF0176 protein